MDHKDTTIGGNSYRIGLLKASDGSWIYSSFVKRYRDYVMAEAAKPTAAPAEDNGEEAAAPPTPPREVGFYLSACFLVEQLNRTELAEMETLCLGSCCRYNGATGTLIALPLLMSDGRLAIKDLEYDGATTLELTKQTIAFNIAPFFPDPGLSAKLDPGDSSQQSTPL